jgi:hypothetical protein
VLDPVLLRLLACKEENPGRIPDTCPYPEHRRDTVKQQLCCCFDGKLAHLYVRQDTMDSKSRSCVLVFVEGQYLSRTSELVERLRNSIIWLDVEREQPYFYIFYYGQPMAQLTANSSRRFIDLEIKRAFSDYSQNEDICIVAPVGRYSEALTINHAKRFSFKAS